MSILLCKNKLFDCFLSYSFLEKVILPMSFIFYIDFQNQESL